MSEKIVKESEDFEGKDSGWTLDVILRLLSPHEPLLSVQDESDVGYILEVDLEYPSDLHDKHSDFPFGSENKPPPNCKEPRLLTTLGPKTKYWEEKQFNSAQPAPPEPRKTKTIVGRKQLNSEQPVPPAPRKTKTIVGGKQLNLAEGGGKQLNLAQPAPPAPPACCRIGLYYLLILNPKLSKTLYLVAYN
ncbi:hypothetical protein TNIN_343251 [Trichonephila inaurata madagascariensis]|uniref:Uncharacterized protein n=1 Tax=Trichonephila inaurata madagascariensis TaxID=2747483 RepID=A0A8X7C1M2_9ARAC|nr:hypothetical protein TNIN_343251 [Trichonephila inaurata madagascariensis]